MLVPVCVEYIELAMASEMPVPLPECIRMNITRPIPERTRRIRNIITNGVNVLLRFHSICSHAKQRL